MDIVHWTHLGHELPEVGLADALVEVADVDGRVLVLLPIAIAVKIFASKKKTGALSSNLPMFGHDNVRFNSRSNCLSTHCLVAIVNGNSQAADAVLLVQGSTAE